MWNPVNGWNYLEMQLQGKEISLMTPQRPSVGVLNQLKMLRVLDKLLKEDVHRFCQSGMKNKGQFGISLLIILLLFLYAGKEKKPKLVAKLMNYSICLKKRSFISFRTFNFIAARLAGVNRCGRIPFPDEGTMSFLMRSSWSTCIVTLHWLCKPFFPINRDFSRSEWSQSPNKEGLKHEVKHYLYKVSLLPILTYFKSLQDKCYKPDLPWICFELL